MKVGGGGMLFRLMKAQGREECIRRGVWRRVERPGCDKRSDALASF